MYDFALIWSFLLHFGCKVNNKIEIVQIFLRALVSALASALASALDSVLRALDSVVAGRGYFFGARDFLIAPREIF